MILILMHVLTPNGIDINFTSQQRCPVTQRITISLPDDLANEIDSRLEYGDSRSAWVRGAIQMRLESERQEDEEGNANRAATTD
jgi:hypothetical protein